MDEASKQFYEGMFLFPQSVTADLNAGVDHIREILDKAGARLISMKKWDERRLAFEIDHQRRGVFFLVYFECDPAKMTGIDRDCNLSERILRVMIVRCDHMTIEEMQAQDEQQKLADEAAMRAAAPADKSEPAAKPESSAPKAATKAAPEPEAVATGGDEPKPEATSA